MNLIVGTPLFFTERIPQTEVCAVDTKTKTERVLPELVGAVREDFAWAIARMVEAAGRLQALEEQLRHDHAARTCCHGTAEALQTLMDRLTKESLDYSGRVLPDATPEPNVLPIQRAKEGA